MLVAVLFALLGLVASDLSPGCGKPVPQNPQPGTSQRLTIQVQDKNFGLVEREYILFVPSGYNNTTPVPLVFDLHGYAGDAAGHISYSYWDELAEEDHFISVFPEGMADSAQGYGSWNCTQSVGPLGIICDTDRETWGELHCYDSCPTCDPMDSCDASSCYDDIGFMRDVKNALADTYCLEMNQIHMTGYSNGGMFAWYAASLALEELGLATMNPVAASSKLGFGLPPTQGRVSVIDFHSLKDTTIPYNLEGSYGEGPHNSIISGDGFYWDAKVELMQAWSDKFGCTGAEEPWLTNMDGIDGFGCFIRTGCPEGLDLIRCYGTHGHDYPVPSNYFAGFRIAWNFMKGHPKLE